MIRKLLFTTAGLAVAVTVVALIQAAGLTLFPPVAGLDFDGKQQWFQYIKTLPVPVLLFALFAWAAGVYAGSVTATVFAWYRRRMGCLIVTGFMFIAAVNNMLMRPHPEWFMVATIIAIPLAGYLAWWTSIWLLEKE